MNSKRCPHGVFNACPDCLAARERRERIATALLTGMLSHPMMVGPQRDGAPNAMLNAADNAIELADYLTRCLDEGKDRPS